MEVQDFKVKILYFKHNLTEYRYLISHENNKVIQHDLKFSLYDEIVCVCKC